MTLVRSNSHILRIYIILSTAVLLYGFLSQSAALLGVATLKHLAEVLVQHHFECAATCWYISFLQLIQNKLQAAKGAKYIINTLFKFHVQNCEE